MFTCVVLILAWDVSFWGEELFLPLVSYWKLHNTCLMSFTLLIWLFTRWFVMLNSICPSASVHNVMALSWSFYFDTGASFINLSHWEQNHSSYHESTEESSEPKPKSSTSEANFWFSLAALSGKVSWSQFWCPCIGTVCAGTDSSTRRLQASN